MHYFKEIILLYALDYSAFDTQMKEKESNKKCDAWKSEGIHLKCFIT